MHPAKNISPYFLSDILRQLEVEEDDFLRAIGKE
jgi:hypothetical protein